MPSMSAWFAWVISSAARSKAREPASTIEENCGILSLSVRYSDLRSLTKSSMVRLNAACGVASLVTFFKYARTRVMNARGTPNAA